MRINHNVPALQSYHSIRNANKATSASMMRLTSGYKINSAKDDAAGLAISNKIRMQLSGIDKANNNSMDGISLVQTADGALQEVHNILQRMRELAIQASNDTLEGEDRDKIQEEIDELLEEIDGISDRTEFNTKKLFGPKANGGDGFTFFNTDNTLSNLTRGVSATEGFPNGKFDFKITQVGTPTTTTLDLTTVTNYAGKSITIDGKTIVFDEGETQTTALAKIRNLAEEMDYEVRELNAGEITVYSQGELEIDNTIGVIPSVVDGVDAQIDTNFVTTIDLSSITDFTGKSIVIDGEIINFTPADDQDSAIAKIRDAADTLGYEVEELISGEIKIYSPSELTINNLSGANIDVSGGTAAANAKFTLSSGAEVSIKSVEYIDNQIIFTLAEPYAGQKASIEINLDIDSTGAYSFNNGTSVSASGEMVSITQYATYADYSKVILQIGPNQDQEMHIEIPQINCKTLGLNNMSYLLLNDAQKAISVTDSAVAEVSRVRSRLGAYQTRLEYTVTSLDSTSTATAESLSRIIDTDMAKEMTNYTTQNLLSQAGISILSQANQRPQQILQLVGQ